MGADRERLRRCRVTASLAAGIAQGADVRRRVCGVGGRPRGLCFLSELGAVKFALINPPWTFDGSIYFGCREPHLPLEYGYSKSLLERAGHTVEVVDAQLEGLALPQVRERVAAFQPDFTVVTTAPS